MAATVRAAYVLEDRATGTARKIKRELSEVERQALATGVALDTIADPKRTRELNAQASAIGGVHKSTVSARTSTGQWATAQNRARNSARSLTLEADLQRRAIGALAVETDVLTGEQAKLSAQSKRTNVGMQETGRQAASTRKEVGSLGDQVRKTGVTLMALNKIIGVMKFPALIAGIGGAVQVVGALGLGLTALMPLLGSAAGGAAAAIPVMAGFGAAMVTAQLATGGLKEALGGNKEALKSLTPEARGFLGVLRDLQKEQRRMQRAAQQGLFPGLTDGLQEARSSSSQVRAILRDTGGDMGNVARSGGRALSQNTQVGQTNVRDLRRLAESGSRATMDMARAGGYLARALVSVGVAAAPFTDWLSSAALDFAKATAEEARLAQQTGRLGQFFDGAKKSLQTLGSIGSSVFGTVRNVMGAASDTGEDLWEAIDRGADSMERWTGSVKGQLAMRDAFADMRPVLKETVGLTGDLLKAIGRLSTGPGASSMLRSLRDALPAVEEGMESLTNSFGPAAVDAIGEVLKLVGTLAQENGPLVLMAKAIGGAATATTQLVTALGPLGSTMLTVLGAGLLLRRVSALKSLATAILGVGQASATAGAMATAGGGLAAATGAATVAGGAAAAARTASIGNAVSGYGAGTVAAAAGAGGLASRLGAAGAAVRGAPGYVRGTYGLARGFDYSRRASAMAALGGAAGLGGNGLVGRAGAVAGKVAIPITAVMALMAAMGTDGGIGAKTQGAFAAIDPTGVVPRVVSDDEKESRGGKRATEFIGALPKGDSIKSQKEAIDRLRTRGLGERGFPGLAGDDSFNQNNSDLKVANKILKAELAQRLTLLKDFQRQQRNALNAKSAEHGARIAEDMADAFDLRAKRNGPVKAMERTAEAVLRKMGAMRPAGAKIVGENTLAWARQQAKGNPRMMREVRKLERAIEDSFSRTGETVQVVNGKILRGTQTEWRGIRNAITTETEAAKQEATDDFTALQNEAVGSLTAMGYSPAQARKLVRTMESGKGTAKKVANKVLDTGSPVPFSPSAIKSATGPKGNATGGRIDGQGLQDTIGVAPGHLAAPGELIVNRHDEADVNRDLILAGKAPLGVRVGRQRKRHSAPIRSDLEPTAAFAKGGRVGVNLMGANPGLASYARMAAAGGLHVSSGKRAAGGRTASGGISQHGSGDALDLAGSAGAMLSFARRFSAQYGPQVDQLIHTPLGYGWNRGRKVPGFGAVVDAGHYDHVHIGDSTPSGGALGGMADAVGGAVTAGAMQMVSLKRRRSKRGGVPGALATAAMEARRRGLEEKVNDALAATGGAGGMDPTGATGGAAPKGQVRNWLARALRITGHYSVANLNALYGRAMQESGGNPAAVNNWDSNAKAGYPSRGLLQTIPQTFNAYRDPNVPGGITDPIANSVAAIRYMFARYGHIVGSNGRGYATGGRVGGDEKAPDWGGWNAKGGSFTVKRPTLFGAGEAGDEDVHIVPKGRRPAFGAGGGVSLAIAPGAVVVHAGSANAEEVGKIVEAKLGEFADMVVQEVGGNDGSDER